MNKKLLSYSIIALAIVIVAVNLWKTYGNKENQKQQTQTEETTPNKDIPGTKITSLDVGTTAPDFELSTLSGEKIKLSDFRGKKIILNFWATWCPPCKAEMPHMENYYEANKDKGVVILAVNLTNNDKGLDVIQNFINDYKLTFPVVLDNTGMIGMKYQAFTIPTSYIIDTKGIIQQKMVGPMDEDTMKGFMDSIN